MTAGLRIRERASPSHGPRPPGAAVDMLMLHYTGMTSAGAALERLCDPAAQVSAHWLVEEDGTVWRMVPEARRAWHAGVSRWAGRDGLNDVSVGIEIVNPGHEWGYRAFPEAQMAAVEALSAAIMRRHAIPAARVVAHSDVAPDRKQDPGELFDWPRLAAAGIGLWPEPDPVGPAPEPAAAMRLLCVCGYPADRHPLAVVLAAFQRRFRPARFDGAPDPETMARLAALARMSA